MIDEEILHRVIDGEATHEEKRSLEEALRREPRLRARYDELRRLQGAIDSVPRLEPPAGLLEAVMRVVRSRRAPAGAGTPFLETVRAAFFRRPGLGLGLAFATGLLVAAVAGGLADLGSWPRGSEASATALSRDRIPGREIHRVTLGGTEPRAEAVAFSAEGRVLVRIRLEAARPADLAVRYAGGEATLGFWRRGGTADTVELGPSGLRVQGAGAGEYELVLPEPPAVDSVEIRLARGGDAYVTSLRVREGR